MKCPTCFSYLPPYPAAFACSGACVPAANATATKARGFDTVTPPITYVTPPPGPGQAPADSVACSRCQQTTSQEVCPQCHEKIPANWRSAKVTTVALAGARATGKSLLLGVAKGQMELLVEEHYRTPLTPIGETEKRFYDTFTRSLYRERRLLQATAAAGAPETRESYIFRFTERFSDGSSRPRILVLRDVAGEDLENEHDESLSYFSRADAVIALFDPLKVNEIRHMLQDLIPSDTRLGGDGLAVIQHVLHLMTGNVTGARTQIPLAVVMSKVDVLQSLRDVSTTKWARIMNRAGSPLQRDPSMRTAVHDHEDGLLLHHEVRGLLEELNARRLGMMLDEVADNYQFFAASALGSAPDRESVDPSGIAPFRVLDPFKWILQVTV